jgi:hypothetical protein
MVMIAKKRPLEGGADSDGLCVTGFLFHARLRAPKRRPSGEGDQAAGE